MQKILVTGANGFVGNAVYRHLKKEGVNVIGSSRRPNDEFFILGPSLNANANWHPLLSGCTTVIHTAGRAHVLRETEGNPLNTFREINTFGTLTLAKQAENAGIQRFIFISSIGVNGPHSDDPFSESDTPRPVDPYAISKFEAENGLWELAKKSSMEIVIIRPTLIYGPGSIGNFAVLLKYIQSGLPMPMGGISNKRTFLGIDNLVDLIMTCIDHPAAANQLYLAGDLEIISTYELIRCLSSLMNRPVRLFTLPINLTKTLAQLVGKRKQFDKLTGNLWITPTKTKEQLGWSPPHTQLDGLKLTVAHFLSQSKNL